jgi:hypothetical protein
MIFNSKREQIVTGNLAASVVARDRALTLAHTVATDSVRLPAGQP